MLAPSGAGFGQLPLDHAEVELPFGERAILGQVRLLAFALAALLGEGFELLLAGVELGRGLFPQRFEGTDRLGREQLGERFLRLVPADGGEDFAGHRVALVAEHDGLVLVGRHHAISLLVLAAGGLEHGGAASLERRRWTA